MKILMIINSLAKGGRERRMLELIKGLTQPGQNFDIYLISMSGLVEYQYVYDLPIRFEIVEKKSSRNFNVVRKLRRIIKSYQPDIIHSWDITASMYMTVAKAFLNKILINGFIANAPEQVSRTDKRYIRVKLLTPFCQSIVANSQAGLKAYRIPASKALCIYNGIDLNRFTSLKPVGELKEEIIGRVGNDSFIAAMVATFDKRKDYATSVRAATSLCQENEKIIVLLIGDGPDWASLRAQVPPNLLNTQIFFLGKRSDIESLLRLCDAGLLMTNADVHGEGISNSIIEYMVSRIPVIATRGGGTNEIVKDGINGFLIDPKNEQQLIDAVKKLIDNPGLAKTMGKNGYQLVQDNFSLLKMTNSFINLYQEQV